MPSSIKKINQEELLIMNGPMNGIEKIEKKSENVYNIVSRVAYLIGVQETIFRENTFQMDIYRLMDNLPEVKTLRMLCILRNGLLKNYKEINVQILYDLKNLDTLPEFIDQEALQYLEVEQEMEIVKANTPVQDYLAAINKLVTDHVLVAIKASFPAWINQSYLRDLFVAKSSGTALVNTYRQRRRYYPYQTFLNASISATDGNILYNDEKFVSFLYGKHGEEFSDSSKVKDSSVRYDSQFLDFMQEAGDIYIMVDCENTSLYKLYSMLEALQKKYPEEMFSKIKLIELFDDINTSNSWKLLHHFTKIKVKHTLVERIKDDKSLVDMKLCAGVMGYFYEKGIRDFLLVSSDSDYYAMIESLPDCHFFTLVERGKTSDAVLERMEECGTKTCFMDDFCSASQEQLYSEAIALELRSILEDRTFIDLNRLFFDAAKHAHLDLTEEELAAYRKKYGSKIRLKKTEDSIVMTI